MDQRFGDVNSGGAPVIQGSSHVEVHNYTTGGRDAVLDWVSRIDVAPAHAIAQDKAVIQDPGAWIFEEIEFVKWMSGNRSSMLWLRGEMGTGKTVLISSVINHFRKSDIPDKQGVLAYFYIVGTSDELKEPMNVLKSILRQLSESDAGFEYLRKQYRLTPRPALSRIVVQDFICGIIKTYAPNPVIILIDALDETPLPHIVIRVLSKIVELANGLVKIFISGRPTTHIKGLLATWPRITLDSDKSKDDIQRYVREHVHSQLVGRLAEGDPLIEEIVTTLNQKAAGMFRWVEMSVEYICRPKRTKNSIRHALNELPDSLRGIYTELMNEIDSSDEEANRLLAHGVFKLLLTAPCSLRSNTIIEAVCIRSRELDETQVTIQDVLLACNHFVVWAETSDEVSFGHISVPQFLLSGTLSDYRSEERQCFLAQLCFSGLRIYAAASLEDTVFPEMSITRVARGRYTEVGRRETAEQPVQTFVDYAALYWAHHCMESGALRSNPESSLAADFNGFFGGFGNTPIFKFWTKALPKALLGWKTPIVSQWYEIFVPIVDGGRLRFNDASTQMPPWSYIDYKATPSALLTACMFNFEDAVKGVKGMLPELMANCLNARLETALHIAAKYNNQGIVHHLLEGGALVYAQNQDRETPFRLAARSWSEPVMRLLLDAGANVNDMTGFGDPVIIQASAKGNALFVKYLLEKGADVRKSTRGGETALHGAAENGHLLVVRLILEKNPDVNARGAFFQWPLQKAVLNGHKEVTLLLLQAGSRIDGMDTREDSPLHLAAKGGFVDVIQHLVRFGANLEIRNQNHETALWLAASSGHLAAVRFLCEAGAEVTVSSGYGGSALASAAIKGHFAVMDELLSHGFDINARFWRGETTLSWVARAHTDLVTTAVSLLLEKGANIDVEDDDGMTPLHIAAEVGNHDVIDQLILKCRNPEAKNHRGETALIVASRGCRVAAVRTLLQYNAEVTATDTDGRTALTSLASQFREWETTANLRETINLLLQAGADKDFDGFDAKSWAFSRNHHRLVSKLS